MFEHVRRRLTLAYVGILALILLLFASVTLVAYRGQTLAREDEILAHEAALIARRWAAGEAPDGNMDASDAYGYVVLGPAGDVLERDATALSLGLPAAGPFAEAADRGSTTFATIDGPEGAVRVASVPEIRGGELVTVTQMATPLDLALAPVTRLALLFLPVGVGALALAAAGGLVLAGRALRPVRAAFDRQRAFVADASHELKTPLALVKLDGDVLRRDPDAPDRLQILDHQGAEIDRMSALLSELLLLARLDAGKLALAREPFDLAPVLAEAAERFRHRAREAGVALEVRTEGALPARGDAERTRQILSALLDNALRFTPPGGCVAVTGSRRAGCVEAAVEDTGPGIDPAHLPHVFDRFYRADTRRATRSPIGGGAGLGLAIARDTARAQGGDLMVANRADGGARATLGLPAAGPPPMEPGDRVADPSPAALAPPLV